ncbi:MAG: sugar transferase [Bacteroidetes bacterium]|nr:sugar transferase [Bacteroidota bacterium]
MNTHYLLMKRGLDVAVATLLLILTLPVQLIVAAAIKCSDGGPVYFLQPRIGRDGQVFRMIKFRSMRIDVTRESMRVDLYAPSVAQILEKSTHDSRVTPVGYILRRTSLDELPQLFNVVLGDMSLVGPRPVVARMLAAADPRVAQRHSVPPGLTGYWQINARSENTSIESMLPYDLRYIEEMSIRTDVKILLRTIPVVLWGEGAY